MFDLSEGFGSNKTAEVEGVWVTLGDGAGVKVTRMGNPQVQRAYRKLPRDIRRQVEEGTMAEGAATDFFSMFLSKNILVDWKGMADGGKPLPKYTMEEGAKFLKKYRRFRDRIWELSLDEDLFNTGEEEDIKNSFARSSGT